MVFQRFGAGVLAAALCALPAAAQEQVAQEQAAQEQAALGVAAPVAAECCTVPALTVIAIEISEALSSNRSKSRQMFAFTLAEPLTVDGHLVAPKGTPGVGEVVHAAKSGIGGKAGELILAARYLDLDGTRVPLRSLKAGAGQGKDNSGAVMTGGMVAAAALPVAALAGFFITGGEVRVPQGTPATAKVAADTNLAPRD